MGSFPNLAKMAIALAAGAALAPGIKAAKSQSQPASNPSSILAPAQGVEQSGAELARELEREARQGSAIASYKLGWIYGKGEGVQRDFQKALDWYQTAALRGNTYAYYFLDMMYEEGISAGRDFEGHLRLYETAASRGNIYAYYPLAYLHERRGNYKEAFKWYSKSSDQGILNAYFPLGTLYEWGKGVDQDMDQARKWYRKTIIEGALLIEELRAAAAMETEN